MEGRKDAREVVETIYAEAVGLASSSDFAACIEKLVALIQDRVFPIEWLSIYLRKENTAFHTHYYLLPPPIGRESAVLLDGRPELSAWRARHACIWQDQTESGTRWGFSVPTGRAIISYAAFCDESYNADQQRALTAIAAPLEAVVRRCAELEVLEGLQAQVATVDQNLMALYDGSYDLSADSPDEVLRKLIQMATQQLSFDRAGIFLLDEKNKILRGALGMDDDGAIVPIGSTVFALYPADLREVAEAALVARGELPYFLTPDLDGSGRRSREGNIAANASVPLRVGKRIIGVMAVDNYYSGAPIYEPQLRPLMILCNQGASALERARLFRDLKEAHGSLEIQVKHRTSELTHANAELEAILQEREVLLKEIHHRVKNNLQVISSLLSMQIDHVEDERTCQLLREGGNRLHSMALIHESLYQAKDLKSIDVGDYLPHLVGDIHASYGDMAAGVRLKIDVASAMFETDTVVNLGLIVNELVTNALKHAFPAGRQGLLEVWAQRVEGELLLVVSDDGVGVSTPINLKKLSSMGMQVVDVLVRQLRGSLSIQGDDGMKISLRIPIS